MPIETTLTLYTFEELSDDAKEVAKEWWLSCRDETDYESVIEDFRQIGELLGISFDTYRVPLMSGATRSDPKIWWRLAYCQGDYAAFEGVMAYRKGMAKAVRAYAPQDETLHAIADDLAAIFAKGFYRDRFTVTHSSYYGTQVEPADDWSDSAHDRAAEVRGIAERLGSWLYYALRKEDEYLRSDEAIADAMAANGYTFEANGERRD